MNHEDLEVLRALTESINNLTITLAGLTFPPAPMGFMPPPAPTAQTRTCDTCRAQIRRGELGTSYPPDSFGDHHPGCPEAARHLPETKDGTCATGCGATNSSGRRYGHTLGAHGPLGCPHPGCPCTAPYGRILPTDTPAATPVTADMPRLD